MAFMDVLENLGNTAVDVGGKFGTLWAEAEFADRNIESSQETRNANSPVVQQGQPAPVVANSPFDALLQRETISIGTLKVDKQLAFGSLAVLGIAAILKLRR